MDDVVAIHRARERLVFHFLFHRRQLDLVNAFRRPNARHRHDESAQLIDGIERFLERRLARDAGIIRMRKNRATNLSLHPCSRSQRHADERMTFGRALLLVG